ncbi:hypothetical protein JOF53_007384 [Crossiella equi]|uniref:Uncharacterized protein n=1 Tax=Crossiella equi TaxID=130796 RepID=A0ABS5AQ34_9PSEU|nr:hypothetical protein [Crossiella equi]MBP2478512.1 hypothetical protein [Crossiella equi]
MTRTVSHQPVTAVAADLVLATLLSAVTAGVVAGTPLLWQHFQLTPEAAWTAVTAYHLGAMLGLALCAIRSFRRSRDAWVRGAGAVFSGSTLVLALAPDWPGVLGGAASAGVAFGVLVVHLVVPFGSGRPNWVSNLVYTCLGLGAVLGPASVATTGDVGGLMAVASGLVLLCLWIRAAARSSAPRPGQATRDSGHSTTRALAPVVSSGAS